MVVFRAVYGEIQHNLGLAVWTVTFGYVFDQETLF